MVLQPRHTPTQFQTYPDEQHTLAFYIKCVPPVGRVLLLRKWVLTMSPPFNEESCGYLEVKAVIYSNLDVSVSESQFPGYNLGKTDLKRAEYRRITQFCINRSHPMISVRTYGLTCLCLLYSLSQASLEVSLKHNVHSKIKEVTKLPIGPTVAPV